MTAPQAFVAAEIGPQYNQDNFAVAHRLGGSSKKAPKAGGRLLPRQHLQSLHDKHKYAVRRAFVA